jgi:hypothetical protein
LAETLPKRPFLPVFKDALHKPDLPVWVRIDQVANLEDLEYWIAQTQASTPFTLNNPERFERTNHFRSVSKQRIYRETSTGYLWYFDRFHKDNRIHYEVFDPTGKVHIGEADSDGNLIASTADKSKHPIL